MNTLKKIRRALREPSRIPGIVQRRIAGLYRRTLKRLYYAVVLALKKEKKILVYCGLNRGWGFEKMFQEYHLCYGFEADPVLYEYCVKKFKRFKNVQIIHGALNTFDGEVTFHISSNYPASSSLSSQMDSDYPKVDSIKYVSQVTVPSINLQEFCIRNNIDHITSYVSDIEGMDLEVLKTMKKYVNERRIDKIQCEVSVRQVHTDLAPNALDDFNKFLSPTYELAGTGWGTCKTGKFYDIPEEYWNMDCLWTLRKTDGSTS